MASERLKERFREIELLAKAAGSKHYEVQFFEVPASLIYEVASYGLPTRYSHWASGRAWNAQKRQGEMGLSKIHELILNNNPSYAFLDNTNTETINLMICAHCLAHSEFFANNVMFRNCGETNMVQVAKRHAEMIDQYRKDYGDDEVDEWLDIALSLERHIDVYKKLKRSRYPIRHIEYKERDIEEWEDLVPGKEPIVKKTIEGAHLPPRPERDVLWFLTEYANLEKWQKHIFEIVRRESYYFYAQARTKIMNEGYASYWHAEIMHQYFLGDDNDYGVKGIKYPLTSEEHLDFLSSHEKVVSPGLKMPLKVEKVEVDPYGRPTGRKIKAWNPRLLQNPKLFHYATRLNPYYVGFRMFRNIKERWDKYYKDGFMLNEWEEKIPVTIDGAQKIREVMESEDDVSFFRNYLTEELAEELHLFSYGNAPEYKDDYSTQEKTSPDQNKKNKTIQVRTKELKDILEAVARDRNNYGAPLIVVRRVDSDGTLRLEHLSEDKTNVDIKYAEHVLKYIYRVWGRSVELIRKGVGSDQHTNLMKYDASGFSVDHATSDYPEIIEQKDTPSSW